MKKLWSKITNRHLFVAGLLVVLLSEIPWLILGENAVVPYHDQLDGEIIAYIYQAKYLFSGQGIIPEFLNGASKTALIPPAPLAVLLFRICSPFAALMLLQALGQAVGYMGMFWLSGKITDKGGISLVAALLYAFLPFLPVYGLSQYGMPLLLLCMYQLYRGERVKGSLLYVILYASLSSLVLCGFAWLGVWACAVLILGIRRKLGEHKGFLAGFALLLAVYVAENLALLGQMLGIGTESVSHKSEYVLSGGGFWSAFWNYLKYNGDHSADQHLWILCLTVATALLVFLFWKKCEPGVRRCWRWMLGGLGVICALCLLAAFWNCSWSVGIRARMGAAGAFQLGRVLWLAPMLWLLEAVFCLEILVSGRPLRKWAGYGCALVFLGGVAFATLKSSLVKPCLQQLLNPEYDAISYSDYLALGVLDQVEAFIAQEEGLEKSEYKVASLGIDPAAALYHGFYCVDGYSNNYDVEYKHAFRKVIAPELEKSDYLKEYYDDWGNRCYLFSAECPGYYTIEKGGFFFSDLEIDTDELKDMGCSYILSAAYVANAEEENLTLLGGEGFETAGSYYRIFVYRIQ